MAITDWLEANIDSKIKYTGNGKEVHCNCPYCNDHKPRLYINVDTGAFHCFNCGASGPMLALIQYVEGVPYSKARSIFTDIRGNLSLPEEISGTTINNMFMGDFRKDLAKRAIPLPEEYKPLDPNHTNIRTEQALRYLHSRGVTDKQILQHKMGFCISGEYESRVIIPITENGELRFWVARAISKDAYMKEKSPATEEYQTSKSEVIFNIDRASKRYGAIVLCEGIFDALSYSDIGVSLLGKKLYKPQLDILLDYRSLLTKGVYVCLDWDAKNDAVELAETLSDYFDNVYLINLKKEDDDPNATLLSKGREYMWELIRNAIPYKNKLSVLTSDFYKA